MTPLEIAISIWILVTVAGASNARGVYKTMTKHRGNKVCLLVDTIVVPIYALVIAAATYLMVK